VSVVRTWTTTSLSRATQFAAFRDEVSNQPLACSIRPASVDHFSSTIRQRFLGGVHMIECINDPCIGYRGPAEIAKNSDPYFGVELLIAGSDTIRDGGQDTVICPGNIGIFDCTRPGGFEATKRFHKFMLLIPYKRMEIALRNAQEFLHKPLNGKAGVGALASNHLRMLSQHLMSIEERDGISVIEVTLHVLAASLEASRDRTFSSRQTSLLREIQVFIDRNLEDPDLTPQQIADAHRISVRYLHLLFAKEAQTVSGCIRNRRLERCRSDLQCRSGSTTILEIALRWGFNDLSSFNRSFKKQYGVCPRDYHRLLLDGSNSLVASNQSTSGPTYDMA
jgi:AraC-like DNA-binding protein